MGTTGEALLTAKVPPVDATPQPAPSLSYARPGPAKPRPGATRPGPAIPARSTHWPMTDCERKNKRYYLNKKIKKLLRLCVPFT